MKSLWRDADAAAFKDELDLRVYTSRLLGQEPALVLHGGGNTSVKISAPNLFGAQEELLYVKGSGWDLASIERAGFAPVRMDHLLKLADLPQLSDLQMVNELRTHMTEASAPTPSIETILHAVLPFKYVDHTHADAVVTVTNTDNGAERIGEIYGDRVVVIPYVMPGFDLARVCAQEFQRQATSQTVGMVLLNHGIFSFGATARESYERMIELVSLAEDYLRRQQAWDLPPADATVPGAPVAGELAQLRLEVSRLAGKPMILRCEQNPATLSFCQHPEAGVISQQGPATPDHIIRTKRVPMLGRDCAAYASAYRQYFESHAAAAAAPLTMLDPAPRVILDSRLGLCTVGDNVAGADIVCDLYLHTMEVIMRATALGGYRALPAADLFQVEYWELEQAKLRRGGAAPEFAGEVALVTGAASGIGKACAEALLARGAAVIGLDRNPAVVEQCAAAAWLGVSCDVTDADQISRALEQGVRRYGGVDMLVLNAGVFPGGCRVADLEAADWRRVMDVNLDANVGLLRAGYPLLKRAPRGGRVVVIGSKNVPAPGPGAAAYSASKAALIQLARVTALEWAADGIRVNSLHPDAVFDTALWTEEVLQARAAHYGVTVAEYKAKNLLKTPVASRDVAALAAALCGDLFAKTTGAQIPVDGGNERVI